MQSARQKAIMERRALNAERVVLVGELQQAVNAGDTSLVQSTITQLKTIETQLAQSIAQSSEAAKATVSANTAATGSNHSMALDAITTATMRWNNVAAALTKADQAMIALVNQLQAALPPPSSGTSTSGTSNSTH